MKGLMRTGRKKGDNAAREKEKKNDIGRRI